MPRLSQNHTPISRPCSWSPRGMIWYRHFSVKNCGQRSSSLLSMAWTYSICSRAIASRAAEGTSTDLAIGTTAGLVTASDVHELAVDLPEPPHRGLGRPGGLAADVAAAHLDHRDVVEIALDAFLHEPADG